MADKKLPDRGDDADRQQDPLVERLRPDPARPPEPTKVLEGALGDSDRPGFRRLYFTRDLDSYAEFRADDVLGVADIPPEQPPLLGEPSTRVTLRRDAPVDFTRTHGGRPIDEFDLDVRLAPGGAAPQDRPITFGEPGCLETNGFGCVETGVFETFNCGFFTEVCTVDGCVTFQRTCVTCATRCQDTCGRTCVTCATCLTCGRTCGPTCGRTCGPTCGPTCETCGPLCRPTIGRTCVTCRCEAQTFATCSPECEITMGNACGTQFCVQ